MTWRIVVTALLSIGACSVSAMELELPDGKDVVGEVRVIRARYEDTFVSLARQHNVGYESLRRANPGVDAWLPGEGTEIVIPTRFVLPRAPREGIVVNVAELRLYYFPKADGTGTRRVYSYPISIGRMDWTTPLGTTTVVGKKEKPTWYPPQSIRDEHAARNDFLPKIVPPGPENPLGEHALYLGISGYLIHGTNRPSGVGMRVTHGCMRMFPEDIEALFNIVPIGTKVHIVNQPYKLGWGEDGLYLEAHPPLLEDQESGEWSATALTRLYVALTDQGQGPEVKWESAEGIMNDARGIPALVSEPVVSIESIAETAQAD